MRFAAAVALRTNRSVTVRIGTIILQVSKSETARLESFSDGVFAVAITLLVLNLKVPGQAEITGKANLWKLLIAQWPSFLAFFSSFITILIIWLNHHMVFKIVQQNDGNFMLINGLLLLLVTLLPFTTAVLAEHIGHFGERDAILFYNGFFLMIGGAFQLLWRYATSNNRLLSSECDKKDILRINKQFMVGLFLYVFTFLLSFFMAKISLGLNIFLAVYFAGVGIFKKEIV
jgi:uncharacterized membrane protein